MRNRGVTMSNRSAKFVCALFASILAGASFGAVAENGTRPADDAKSADNCLSAPKGVAPAGSHWYYRLDRATKHQCWYIGEAKSTAARAARATPQNSAVSTHAADNASPQHNPTVSKLVADARAEWTSPMSSGVPNTDVTGSVAAADTGPHTAASDNTQSSAIASRWPDGSEVSSSNDAQLAADDPAASPQTGATPEPQLAVGPTAAKPSNSTQMLLIVMTSALAFAGLVAAMIFRFNRKPAAPADVRDDQPPAPWDSIHIDRPSLPSFMHEEVPIRRAGGAQAPRGPGDAEKQIAEMLARLARGASA